VKPHLAHLFMSYLPVCYSHCSAISVAERVAEERAENAGETVGYQIRLERRTSSQVGRGCPAHVGRDSDEVDPSVQECKMNGQRRMAWNTWPRAHTST